MLESALSGSGRRWWRATAGSWRAGWRSATTEEKEVAHNASVCCVVCSVRARAECVERYQKRSDAKLVVAFLKLFLVEGFVLDKHAYYYRDAVHEVGTRGESAPSSLLAK